MRHSFTPRGGFVLMRSLNIRQQAERRRVLTICGLLLLALASGVIGSLTHPRDEALGRIQTGPFSYFPSQ